MANMNRSIGALGSTLLLACSCGAGTSTPPATPVSTVEAHDPSAASAYDVHEWGLLRALPGDVLTAGAVAPAIVRMPIAVDKPVLYFHLDGHSDGPLTLRSVSVDAHGGAIVEAWPFPPRTDVASELRWTDVVIDPNEACTPSALPTASDPACTSLPAITDEDGTPRGQTTLSDHAGAAGHELCEVAQLDRVRAAGAACVRTAGTTDSLLFYRTRTRAFTPPLTFERTGTTGEVRVTNTGDAPIPGWIVRLRDEYGSVSALAARPPAPHESVVVGADFRAAVADIPPAPDAPRAADDEMLPAAGGSPEPGRRAIRDTMRELGLNDAEIDAFLRAWNVALFNDAAPTDTDRSVPIDVLTADGRFDGEPPPSESFVYFLPRATCDDVASVTFDPPPRSFSRAFAVWSPLRASGVGH